MNKIELILRIKTEINEAHKFSKNLGAPTSIHRDYLLAKLNDVSPTEIHIGLLDLKDQGQIEFGNDPNVIVLTEKYKQ